MPDIDRLMEEWPPEFEDLLKEVGLPTADMDCDLSTYVDMICGKWLFIISYFRGHLISQFMRIKILIFLNFYFQNQEN